jgi:hypothetical protein
MSLVKTSLLQTFPSWQNLRRFFAGAAYGNFALLSAFVAISTASPAGEQAAISLGAITVPGQAQQLKLVVEVAGELKLNADGKEVRRVPVAVEANAELQERWLATEGSTAGSMRQYRKCEAKIRIQDKEFTHVLRTDRQLLACNRAKDRVVLVGPFGPLTREELELVEAPFQSILLTGLLPDHPVKLGDTWTISDGTLQALFNLDAIIQQQVSATFKEVKDGVALVELSGRLSGAAEGVSSDIDFKAKLNVQIQQQAVTWLAASIREHRAVGHARPGFETVTKLRLLAEPCAIPPELSDQALAQLPEHTSAASQLLELSSDKGGYALLHDRRWRRMTDRHDVAVLRFVDQGDLIAQCNISTLPALPKGQQLTLEGFQQDIRRGLGKDFDQFIEATQQLSDDKALAIYRVVAVGSVQEIPIQWVHYYLADNEGRRASVVFTLEQKVAERFGTSDRTLVPGFRFTRSTTASSQTSQRKAESKR